MNVPTPNDFLVRLRSHLPVFDIIVGDFGREAAARYVALLGSEERRVLGDALSARELPFFDEYRRLMFTLVADISYLKRGMISRAWTSHGRLTDDVLVAVKSHEVPDDLKMALEQLLADEVNSALRRGYRQIRVVLPCNSLSDLVESAVAHLEVERLASGIEDLEIQGDSSTSSPSVVGHGVIQSALQQLAATGRAGSPLLVLGSSMAQEQYRRVGAPLGIEVLPITMDQQALVDEAVIACIGGGKNALGQARRMLREQVIEPHCTSRPELLVVEACTDFDFGLGLDSVGLLAERMVAECYQGLLAAN